MPSVVLTDNMFWVGAKDPGLRIFDLIVKVNNGSTYNSYLLVGEKVALIDTVKDGFEDQLFANIQEEIPLSRIDYLIVNHNEPDHSGAIKKLLSINPNIKLICSKPALPFLQNVINDGAVTIQSVKGGETLDLGGLTLEFLSTPFMHWPDTMMCYNPENRILFSCDGYASHFCPTGSIFGDASDQMIQNEAWYYFDCIMRPFSPFARKATQAIVTKEIALLAPSHGPIFKDDPMKVIHNYLQWTEPKYKSDRTMVALFYTSSYGNTKLMAEEIMKAINPSHCDVHLLDLATVRESEIRDRLESCDAVLFGTPTFVGDVVKPVWEAAHLLTTIASSGKKAAVFGSYAWGGQAVDILENYLEALKLKVMKPGVRARLVPSPAELEECRQFGIAFSKFASDV